MGFGARGTMSRLLVLAGSVVGFATRQIPPPVYAGDCSGCPATGGPGQVGTPSAAGFVAKANGAGQTALS
jgi:hypothetical protein